jgi:hypothetical protein
MNNKTGPDRRLAHLRWKGGGGLGMGHLASSYCQLQLLVYHICRMCTVGLVGSALPCCKAVPSSNPGSAPQGDFSLWAKQATKKKEKGLGEWIWVNVLYLCDYECMKQTKRNKKSGICHQTFEKKFVLCTKPDVISQITRGKPVNTLW